MSHPFQLSFTPEAVEGISKLPANLKRIADGVFIQIAAQPKSGKKLVGKLKGIYSERVTRRYRILYMIKPSEHRVIILDFKLRRDAYGE